METGENRLLAVLAHVSMFFLPLILPLVLMLVKNNEPFVRHHATQALVFHLIFWAASAISGFLMFVLIGFILLPIVSIFGLVVTIIAVIRTLDSDYYRYPISGHWID